MAKDSGNLTQCFCKIRKFCKPLTHLSSPLLPYYWFLILVTAFQSYKILLQFMVPFFILSCSISGFFCHYLFAGVSKETLGSLFLLVPTSKITPSRCKKQKACLLSGILNDLRLSLGHCILIVYSDHKILAILIISCLSCPYYYMWCFFLLWPTEHPYSLHLLSSST